MVCGNLASLNVLFWSCLISCQSSGEPICLLKFKTACLEMF